MTFYTDMQAIASSLLTEFDQGNIVITTVTPGAGPAHNPGSPTEVDTAVKGTVRGVSQKYIDGSLIVAGDFQLTIPGGVWFRPRQARSSYPGSNMKLWQ